MSFLKILAYFMLICISTALIGSYVILIYFFNINAPFLVFNILLGMYLLITGADYIDKYFRKVVLGG